MNASQDFGQGLDILPAGEIACRPHPPIDVTAQQDSPFGICIKDIRRQPRGRCSPQDAEFTGTIQTKDMGFFVIQPQHIRFTTTADLVNAVRQATF